MIPEDRNCDMKNLKMFIRGKCSIPALSMACMLACALPFGSAHAQHGAAGHAMVVDGKPQRLKADLSTPADRKDKQVYFRVVTPNEDGSYNAEITDQKGQLRMTGSFLDPECRIAEGSFTYYHPNGTVESTGMYSRGLKAGTWICYQINGSPRAERNYSGMSWEDYTIALGLASMAATLDADDPVR
jgi:hypothetical protein